MLRFARQEGKRRGGHTWLVLVAGEWPGEEVEKGAAARLVLVARKANHETRERERGEREKEIDFFKEEIDEGGR